MNTIKTAVVTATLLAVGYGAHVVMNKPIPQEGVWDAPGVGQDGAPAIEIPPLLPAQTQPEPSSTQGLGMNNAPGPFAPAGSYGQTNPITSPPPETLVSPTAPESNFNSSAPGNAAQIPDYGDPTGAPASFEQRLTHTEQVPPKPNSNFDTIWQTSQSSIANGQLADALFSLSMLYRDNLTESQRNMLVPLLDQLAGTVIYSRKSYLDAPWASNAPTALQDIATQASIPVEFLGRVNGIPVGTVIPAGTELKIVRGPFRGILELSRRELTIFLGQHYAGRFNVSIGRDLAIAQPTVFAVRNKTGAQQYLDPRTNQSIAAGDPANPLGNHWIELVNQQHAVIGIHSGRTDASDSRGFISVSEKDADDLQAILSINSTISIVP
ncbi:MAG: hypothetical protein AAF497_09535 [Planctomycetota bacterium]